MALKMGVCLEELGTARRWSGGGFAALRSGEARAIQTTAGAIHWRNMTPDSMRVDASDEELADSTGETGQDLFPRLRLAGRLRGGRDEPFLLHLLAKLGDGVLALAGEIGPDVGGQLGLPKKDHGPAVGGDHGDDGVGGRGGGPGGIRILVPHVNAFGFDNVIETGDASNVFKGLPDGGVLQVEADVAVLWRYALQRAGLDLELHAARVGQIINNPRQVGAVEVRGDRFV